MLIYVFLIICGLSSPSPINRLTNRWRFAFHFRPPSISLLNICFCSHHPASDGSPPLGVRLGPPLILYYHGNPRSLAGGGTCWSSPSAGALYQSVSSNMTSRCNSPSSTLTSDIYPWNSSMPPPCPIRLAVGLPSLFFLTSK